jgi:glycine betaine/proline transport system substrate-binding protein
MKKLVVLLTVMMLALTILGAKTVKLAYVNWAEGIAMTNLVKVVLEDKMGYDVDMTMADPGVVYASIARGFQDAFLDGWLPVTHKSYMEQFRDDITDLGYNFEGARIGLVVPTYVEIDSIEEMNEHKDKFDGRIVGIDPGAGIMQATERAIDEYDLDIELVESSGPVMTASIASAVKDGEWIAVTGWQPHWKFAKWDLKFLEDKNGVYGAVENIHTIARRDLIVDMPEVAQFLTHFYMDSQHLGDLMGAIAESDEDAEDVARAWMNDNWDYVKVWLE